jgi:trk system potassium uptake protein TrkH
VIHLLPVLNVLSVVILVFSLAMSVPLLVSYAFDDAAFWAFDQSMLITAGIGMLLRVLTRGHRRELEVRDGFLLVSLVWTVLPAFATLPLLRYFPELSFTDAYFETVSGITTTGATVLTGLDSLPGSINLWRSLLVWLGGMGIIVLTVAILPLLGVGGSQIYKAETPGPMKETRLAPRIAETAKGLWLVYFFITVACVLCYRWAGMSWSDAFVHAFSTMGLGGFSSHDAGYAFWNSQAIEIVAIVFMLVAGMNFGTHFLAWRRLSLKPYQADPEAGWFLFIVLGSCVLIAAYLVQSGVYEAWPTALRHASFNVVSIATTAGFSSVDYNQWPVFAPLWMLFLASFATCAGSTGGGMKMIRAVLLFKQVFREILRTLHPRVVRPVKLAGVPVENQVIFAVLAWVFIYVSCVILLTLLLTASGLDVVSAFSAVVACISNTGPGIGQVGPATTFAVLSDFQTWVCTVTMLLGRLELLTLIIVLTPAFWQK